MVVSFRCAGKCDLPHKLAVMPLCRQPGGKFYINDATSKGIGQPLSLYGNGDRGVSICEWSRAPIGQPFHIQTESGDH